MAIDDPLETALDGDRVEIAFEPQRDWGVVEGVVAFEPIEKPKSLLRECRRPDLAPAAAESFCVRRSVHVGVRQKTARC